MSVHSSTIMNIRRRWSILCCCCCCSRPSPTDAFIMHHASCTMYAIHKIHNPGSWFIPGPTRPSIVSRIETRSMPRMNVIHPLVVVHSSFRTTVRPKFAWVVPRVSYLRFHPCRRESRLQRQHQPHNNPHTHVLIFWYVEIGLIYPKKHKTHFQWWSAVLLIISCYIILFDFDSIKYLIICTPSINSRTKQQQ